MSVDPPEKSEALRVHLALPFPILCDTDHRVIREWDIYNSAEKGGIAKPAVFVIDPNRVIRYATVDGVVNRVPASAILALLRDPDQGQALRRKAHLPTFAELKHALGNFFRR